MEQAARAGARIIKPAQDTFYGGYAGYFSDPDGHLWEIVWNPATPGRRLGLRVSDEYDKLHQSAARMVLHIIQPEGLVEHADEAKIIVFGKGFRL